jgi:hypothetical protein
MGVLSFWGHLAGMASASVLKMSSAVGVALAALPGYGKLTLPPGYWETAGSPPRRCHEPAFWGHDGQAMTDLAEPGQYSFLMSK